MTLVIFQTWPRSHILPFWINWDTYPHCSAFLYLEMLRQVCTYREIFQYNLIACKLSPRRLVVFKEQCIQIILLKAFYLLYFFLQITHFFLWARTHLSARLHLSDIYKNVTVIWNIIIWASTFIPVQKWGNTTFIFWYFYRGKIIFLALCNMNSKIFVSYVIGDLSSLLITY